MKPILPITDYLILKHLSKHKSMLRKTLIEKMGVSKVSMHLSIMRLILSGCVNVYYLTGRGQPTEIVITPFGKSLYQVLVTQFNE